MNDKSFAFAPAAKRDVLRLQRETLRGPAALDVASTKWNMEPGPTPPLLPPPTGTR
jgi:hypothetical protein